MTPTPTPPPVPGRWLAVGGQCRKVGKSALLVDIIKAFPNRRWTSVKITPYAESGCPLNGRSCRCAPSEHTFAIREERDLSGISDTSRFLAAGATRSLWVQSKENRLQDSLPALAAELAGAEHVIIESDALVKFWKPYLFLMVLDPAILDFKVSARENLNLADAFVFRSPINPSVTSSGAIASIRKPEFFQPLGETIPEELLLLISGSFP